MSEDIYSDKELYSMGSQRSFNGDAAEAAFLLGGIGTGNISVGARGELRDWEIFNKPGKGNKLPYTFFAIRIQEAGSKPVTKVIESQIKPPYNKAMGFAANEAAGLPRFKKSSMRGEYPFVRVDFEDDSLPVKVSLEAFNPFIPLNPEDSGIPCAILKYKAKNLSDKPVEVSIAGSILNAAGFEDIVSGVWLKEDYFVNNVNEFRQDSLATGLYLYSGGLGENHLRNGNMALITPERNVTVRTYWPEGSWWDGIQVFWDDFSEDGLLEDPGREGTSEASGIGRIKVGSMGIPCSLGQGEEKEFVFILTWYFPNRIKDWQEKFSSIDDVAIVKNHYCNLFKDAWDIGRYLLSNYVRLENDSKNFHRALFSSTLPDYVIEALSCNITVLRSPTCFWLEDGSFLGWEGVHDKGGSCEGTCTHVWNYAQTLAFLFPSLERSMRNIEFNKETDENGKMAFRTHTVFDLPRFDFHPAADGQLGTIIRLYREWKLSGDHEFLAKMWEGARRALDFAIKYWDSDGDFVLNSQQHNTYDIEFYGPNSLVNSMFFGALKAAAEMASAMGEEERAVRYIEILQKGSNRMDELLWGGEYYIQNIDDVNRYKYQYGKGCLSDQLLGQLLCHIVGLGYILPEEHVKKAVKSVFSNNFIADFSNHVNPQRTYVLNDEKGLVLCTWPSGGRPRLPFIYSDEVWTGIEYQVAAHLICEGLIDEGLTIVKAVRERHDGYKRNPWNEVECGYHYARSMASWAILIALSGYKCDLTKGMIEFSPVINKEDFSCFFSCGKAWGIFRQKYDTGKAEYEYLVDILYGNLDGVKVVANGTQITAETYERCWK